MTLLDHEHKRTLHRGEGLPLVTLDEHAATFFRLRISSTTGSEPMNLRVHPAVVYDPGPHAGMALTFQSIHCEGCWAQVYLSREQVAGLIEALKKGMEQST